jgi:hypothetical protein
LAYAVGAWVSTVLHGRLSSRLQHWSVQPCVRPLDAVHMTAYPGSIPDVASNT